MNSARSQKHTKKSITFLYTNSYYMKTEIYKTIHFIIVLKKFKYLFINLM